MDPPVVVDGKQSRRGQAGATLIELLVFILIVGVAVTGVMGALALATRDSADPILQIRGAALGQAYLDEILSKRFDGTNCVTRAGFDGVSCYDAYCADGEQPPRDALGNVRPGYAGYRVHTCVSDATVQGQLMRRVTVRVHTPGGDSMAFTGFKGDNP